MCCALPHVDFSLIHEVEDTDKLLVLDPLEVEEGMLVGIAPHHISEEGRASGEDHFLGIDLGLITGKRHIEKVFLFLDVSEGSAHPFSAFRQDPEKRLVSNDITINGMTFKNFTCLLPSFASEVPKSQDIRNSFRVFTGSRP